MQVDNLSFWGIILILTGVALLIRVIFNIEFPVLRILAGSFLVLLGIKIMAGSSLVWPIKTADNEFFFRSETIDVSPFPADEYQLVFSRTTFDLSEIKHPDQIKDLKINSVFSGCTVYLPVDLPVNIRVDAVFAGVKMPARNTPLFGSGRYRSDDYDPEGPGLDIRVNVVFGSAVLIYRQGI